MHTIRLRGPWSVARNGQSATIEFPAAWQAIYDQFGPGAIPLTRRFGQPTGVEVGDSLTLVVEAAAFVESVELNGATLGDVKLGEVTRFDVTGRLWPRNELGLFARLPEAACGDKLLTTIADVRLEICQAGPTASR
jgi:hypothetical protein